MTVEEGTRAPDFSLASDAGETVTWSSLRGTPVVLFDPDHSVSELYGVWAEPRFAGDRNMGIKRSTFVIDADGNVVEAGYGVKPGTDPARVLAALPA